MVGALVFTLNGEEIARTELIAAATLPRDAPASLEGRGGLFRPLSADVFSPDLPRWMGPLTRQGSFLTL